MFPLFLTKSLMYSSVVEDNPGRARIIYNQATGELAYGQDDSSAVAAMPIANIGRDLELNANHIHII